MSKEYAVLYNDFHVRKVRVEWRNGQPLTPNQWRSIRAKLCGVKGCSCGVIRGAQMYQLVDMGCGPDGSDLVRIERYEPE